MNKKIKVVNLILILLIVSVFMVGCNKKSSEDEEIKNKKEKVSLLGKDKDKKEESKKNKNDSWTDEDGLVKIWKEGKDYYIYYDIKKWDKIHNISEIIEEEYMYSTVADRELLILGLEEDIKDVAIVNIDGYGGGYYSSSEFPIIFMLMDSGEVNWMYAYPPMDSQYEDEDEPYKEEEQYVYGYLPYLEDIVSFSYEVDGEGFGDLTLFAVNEKGLRYDVRHILDYNYLVYSLWSIFPSQDYGGEYDSISFSLSEDGEAMMYTVKDGIDTLESYSGHYEIHLDDSSSKGYRAPSISFNLKSDDSNASFKGTYLMDLEENFDLTLYHVDGDAFVKGEDYFTFIIDSFEGIYDEFNIWYYTDDEFMDYFLESMPSVKEKIEKHGMSLLVDGDYTDLTDYDTCRNIILGTNHNNRYVREVYYTVTEYGIIFEYNPLDDLWYLVYDPYEE